MQKYKIADRMPSKWLVVGAMMTFLGTAFLSIAINSTEFKHGFDMSQSISHYVGLEYWSAIVFTIGNMFVAAFIGKFLWELGEFWKMPKIFYVLIVILATTLLGLSFCPSGTFDPVNSEAISLVSWVHYYCSRGMFITMMLIAAMIVMCRRANTPAHLFAVLYLMFAILCISGYMAEDAWFINYVMIYETMYLFSFMLMLSFCDERREHLLHPDFDQTEED